MITVGNIKAEVLLKIEGMEGTYSVGHIEIPVNVSTDEKRPLHMNVRADTGGVARSVKDSVDGFNVHVASSQTVGALRREMARYNKENY